MFEYSERWTSIIIFCDCLIKAVLETLPVQWFQIISNRYIYFRNQKIAFIVYKIRFVCIMNIQNAEN